MNYTKIKLYFLSFIIAIIFLILLESQFSSIITLIILFSLLYIPYTAKKNQYVKFLLPTIIVLAILTFIPFLISIFLAFFNVTGSTFNNYPWNLIYFTNYVSIINSSFDLLSVFRTFEFSIIAVIIELSLGLFIGYLLYRLPPKFNILNTLFIIPVILPSIISGMLWRAIFDQSFGLANKILGLFQIGNISWLSLDVPSKFPFHLQNLLNINLGFLSALLAEIWQWTPFIAVLISASFKAISSDMVDYFRLHNKSKLKIFWILYLPYIKQIILIISIIRFIDCFKTYETIWALYGNNVDISSISIRLSTYVLDVRNYGLGAAFSILILLTISLIILLFVKQLRTKKILSK